MSNVIDIDTAVLRARLECPNAGCSEGYYPDRDGEPEQCQWCDYYAETLRLCDAVDALRAELTESVATWTRLWRANDALTADLAALRDQIAPLPCGHPAACVTGDTTKYCRWCAELSTRDRRVAELERNVSGAMANLKPVRGRLFWGIVARVFGQGSTNAVALCREYGRDPESGKPALTPDNAGKGEV